MSAKKSWDIAPKPKAPTPVQSPVRGMHDIRPKPKQTVAPVAVPVTRNVTFARGKKAPSEKRAPLKKRREKQRKVFKIALVVLGVALIAVAFYVIWLPALRIDDVRASGAHAQEIQNLAQPMLYGTHLMLVPRSSIFFIPEREIRARILEAYPDVEAVSISADGLTTLTIESLARATAFSWCGTTRDVPHVTCFETNAEGLVFRAAGPIPSGTALKVYAPLDSDASALDYPLRAHIVAAAELPDILRFVKAVQSLGAEIDSFAVRGDEADLYTKAGTRITYVIGHEEQAATLAATAFPSLTLNDGSLSYIDLRFNGKAYFKRVGE